MSLVLWAGALTGILLPSDRPVRISRELCFGAAYPGIPYGEDSPPRTKSGQLINSVVQTAGPNGPGVPVINMGCPGAGSLNRLIVLLAHSEGPGAPGNGYSPTRTRSEDPILSVISASKPDGSGVPCDEDSSTRARYAVSPDCSYNTTRTLWPKCWGHGDVSGSIVTNIPGDELAMSIGYLPGDGY